MNHHSAERDFSDFSIIDLPRDASIFFKKDTKKSIINSQLNNTYLDRTDVVLEDL